MLRTPSGMCWHLVTLLGMAVLGVRADHPLWINEIEELQDIGATVSRSTDTDYRYRLPQNVVPLEYDVYIDLYFAERTARPFSYDGRVTTIIQAIEENVTSISTNFDFDTMNEVSLTTENGDSLEFEVHLYIPHGLLQLNLQRALDVGRNYTLIIGYSMDMNEGPLKRGIWRGWYTDDNGVERIYVATHFQPYSARRAFPCWDEPLFKAVFKLHLSKPSEYNATFSNTRLERSENVGNNRIRDSFLATPKMSSYLVTFLVSESFRVIASDTSFDPPIRIIGRSNTAGLGNHALQLAVGMTKYFDEYFKIPYSTLHPNLLNDHIASPDWASAGTENWGMVSYRELHMIIDPRETIMSVEHYSATLVSHELAHKWFGNLITCYWWSNTWINEGFASYFGYIAAHQVFPQYDLDKHFNARYLQASLAFDSGLSTVPLNHEVTTPAQVTAHFGTISYSKGAAFVRMLADMITPETFRKACHYFLVDNMYEAVDQHDLFKALERAVNEDRTLDEYETFSLAEYYHIWVNEPGYPLLTVNVNHNSGVIQLRQARFFINGTTTSTQLYPIPITYFTTSNSTLELKPSYMMTSEEAQIRKTPGREWVIVNVNQHGHYRVTYDDETWNLISEALLNSPQTINELNRAQVVDDVFAFMRSGKMTYSFGFKILKFLRYETSYYVWRSAISGYTFIRNRFRHNPPETQATFDSFILSYMETVIREVGFEPSPRETVTDSLLRQEVLHFACTLEHVRCMNDSQERFEHMMLDARYWVDPRIRRHVFEMGVKKGGKEAFEFLLYRFKTSNMANDQLEMLRGLASTGIPDLLTKYLEMTLEKIVRHQDKVTAFNYALLGNKENTYTVLQFVKDNIDAIRIAYIEDSRTNPVHTVLSNLASYLDEAELTEYNQWLQTTQSISAQYNSTRSAISTARDNMAWGRDNAEMILAAARDGAATIIVSSVLLITMSLSAILLDSTSLYC